MRNFSLFFGFLFVGLSMLWNSNAYAEFECTSEVYYTWSQGELDPGEGERATDENKKPEDTPKGEPGSSVDGSSAPGAPSPAAAGVDKKGRRERFFVVQRRGADEAAAKNLLVAEVERQKGRASERCKKAHESAGECISTKLSIKSSSLNSLSFSARTEAEKAILAECQVGQGRCLPADSTSPQCRDLAAQDGGAAKGGGAEPKAGGSKSDPKAKDAKPKDAKKK